VTNPKDIKIMKANVPIINDQLGTTFLDYETIPMLANA
jgi:hypothetical protein